MEIKIRLRKDMEPLLYELCKELDINPDHKFRSWKRNPAVRLMMTEVLLLLLLKKHHPKAQKTRKRGRPPKQEDDSEFDWQKFGISLFFAEQLADLQSMKKSELPEGGTPTEIAISRTAEQFNLYDPQTGDAREEYIRDIAVRKKSKYFIRLSSGD